MENKENKSSSYEQSKDDNAVEKSPEQQKAERLERIDKELGSFNEKTKSPEEIKNIENERSQHYQQKVDQLENVLGPLGDESKRLVQKGLVKDVIEQANKDNARYDELQTEKAKLEGSEPIESSESDGLVRMMEYKLGTKLPVDREELFRNFDKYVPKDFEGWIVLGNKDNPSKKYTRDGIRNRIERDIFGASMKDVEGYFNDNLAKAERALSKSDISDEEMEAHDKAVELANNFNSGSLGRSSAELEQRIREAEDGAEKDALRTYVTRLYAEMNRGKQGRPVSQNELVNYFNEMKKSYGNVEYDEFSAANCDYVLRNMKKGNFSSALEEIETNIGHIQHLIAEKGNTKKKMDYRKSDEKSLKELYGEDYLKKLNQLRNYREYLIGTIKGDKKVSKFENGKVDNKSQEKPIEKKNGSEKEKTLAQQLENNAHSEAKNIKGDLALFFDSIRKPNTDLQAYKDELDEILYRTLGIEHSEYKNVSLSEADDAIFFPLIKFREELDSWNTFSHVRREDFEKRFLEYLKDTFGMEIYEASKGETYDKKMYKSIKTTETKDRALDWKIKEAVRPGFKINNELAEYYREWFDSESQKINKRSNEIKGKITQEEFDEQYEKGAQWKKKYSFSSGLVRPAEVELYRFKG